MPNWFFITLFCQFWQWPWMACGPDTSHIEWRTSTLQNLQLQPLPNWSTPATATGTSVKGTKADIQGEQELVLSSVEPWYCGGVGAAGAKKGMTCNHIQLSLKGDRLTPDQQDQMTNKVFSSHDEDFRCTGVVKHQIPTGSACERYRPVPPSRAAELWTLLQNMLDSGVVRESASPWAAPVVLVKKKDGSWRFCVDYRRLNSLTHKDADPLPCIEESLTGLKRGQMVFHSWPCKWLLMVKMATDRWTWRVR